jgi:hypothetical protein
VLSFDAGKWKVPNVDQQLRDRDEFLLEIKDRLQYAKDLMKGNCDHHHWKLEFVEGDLVWLHLHHCLATILTNKARA